MFCGYLRTAFSKSSIASSKRLRCHSARACCSSGTSTPSPGMIVAGCEDGDAKAAERCCLLPCLAILVQAARPGCRRTNQTSAALKMKNAFAGLFLQKLHHRLRAVVYPKLLENIPDVFMDGVDADC